MKLFGKDKISINIFKKLKLYNQKRKQKPKRKKNALGTLAKEGKKKNGRL